MENVLLFKDKNGNSFVGEVIRTGKATGIKKNNWVLKYIRSGEVKVKKFNIEKDLVGRKLLYEAQFFDELLTNSDQIAPINNKNEHNVKISF